MSSEPHSPDTTDQTLAERAHREWRHIFDAIAQPAVILDTDFRITCANRAVQHASGKREQDLIGKKCYEVFHGPDATQPATGCPMETMLASGRVEPLHMEMQVFGGWYLVSCTPVLDDAGRPERVIHIATDITSRTQIDHSLRLSEARYRELVDHMSSGVAVYEAVDDGADFVFRDFNEAGQRIDQTPLSEVVGRRVTEVFPGVKDFGLLDVFRRVWKTGTPEHFPVALYKDERISGWRENFVYRLPSGDVVAVYDDVTESKQAEERLEHLNAVLRAVRNVNQLITRETDRERLLHGVCDNLLETRGYVAAWAVLLDETGGVGPAVGSGLGEEFEAMIQRARSGAVPSCIKTALAQPGFHVFAPPHDECLDCALRGTWSTSSVATTRLSHEGRVYGVLAVCMPPDYAADAEEQDLLREVANDVAYALRQIELVEARQQAEHALRESEEKHRLLLEHAGIGIGYYDLDGTLLLLNQVGASHLGASPEDFVGKTMPELFGEDTAATYAGRIKAALATGETEQYEDLVKLPTGTKWFVSTYARVTDATGNVLGVQVVSSEITERKLAEEALRESEQRYRGVYETAPLAFVLWDRECVVTGWNEAAERIFGWSPEEAIGRNFFDFLIPETTRVDVAAIVDALLRGELPSHSVNENLTKDDRTILCEWNNTIRRDADGNVIGAISLGLDITERRRAEQALARQAAELERSNAELQQFAYVASHDLQEPLRKVTSYLQLLEERYTGRLDAGADEFIGFAVDGARRMKRLIQDLLEYSRVGTRGTPFEATDTGALLERVLRDLQVTLSESLAHVTHDPLPTVMADSVQLSQIFQNMITNAVKFRGDEPPRIHVWAEQRGGEWVFAVRDNGIGIDPRMTERIFVMFQRLHGRGKYPGTGIGLAICKKIIERHGGRVWVESEPGRGSTFYFSLPAIEGERP